MLPNRIHISKRASEQLKQIKSRTGLNPNILCRIALIISLEEQFVPDTYNIDLSGLEFNLATLFGEAANVYEALLKQVHGEKSPKHAEMLLAAHIDHGVERIKRVRNLLDLVRL